MGTPRYLQDARCRSLETRVTAHGHDDDDRHWVALDDTVFYPDGGGQPCDVGAIRSDTGDESRVTGVERVGDVIRHYLERPPAGVIDAASVVAEIDWARRFDHMQQHSGQHLLTAICDDRFGCPTTAFHLGETYASIDLDTDRLSRRKMDEIEDAVNAAIRDNCAISARVESRSDVEALIEAGRVRSRGLPEHVADDVRLVEIDGIDLNTCGGTHVGSTAELQACRLIDTEKAKGATRLRFLFGERLVRWTRDAAAREAALRTTLGVPAEDLVDTVAQWADDRRSTAKRLERTETEYATALGRSLAREPGDLVAAHLAGRDAGFIRRAAEEATRDAPEKTVVLFGDDGTAAFFQIALGERATGDAAELGKRVLDTLGAKGGGKGRAFQGRGPDASRIPDALAQVT